MAACASSLLAWVFPDECRICGQPLREASRIPVCGTCLRKVEPLSADYFCVSCRTPFLNRFPLDADGRCALCRSEARGFDAAYSFGAYDGALRQLIHLLKYQRIRPLARALGGHLVSAYPLEERFDAIVPMPLHWYRFWRRGFNQAAKLAKELGRRRGLPVVRAVRRKRATSSQAGLSAAKRRTNVRDAFTPRRGRNLEGKRVLLVDDVMTTGASASACARALKKAGASYVAVLTLARADRRFAPVTAQGARGVA